MTSLGDKIKTKRLELGITLEKLAEITGVTKSTIQKWESGHITSMRISKIEALSNALNVGPEFFISNNKTLTGRSFTNNGILGDNNNNNLIFNGCKTASQLDRALLSLCYSLTTTQKKQVMEYIIKILSEEEK